MPPQISDDEEASVGSIGDISEEIPVKVEKPAKEKAAKVEKEALKVESEDDEDDDDEDIGEDEYIVEAITDHVIDEEGILKFEVKWEGYEKKSDRTWEPEENLDTASKILDEYLASKGGKDALMSQWEVKKALAVEKKGKKRGRSSTGVEQNGAKKGKRNGTHPVSGTPPASAKSAEFKPPSGSWEDEVVGIDACEGNEGKIVVFLTWKGGEKTQHPLNMVYRRCPQKMLKFYENHLVFKKNDDEAQP